MKHWNGRALFWACLVLSSSVLFLHGILVTPVEVLDSYAVLKMLICMFPWSGLFLKSCKDGISESCTEDLRWNLYLLLWGVTALAVSTLCYAQRTLALALGFPAFAMLTGWNIDRLLREGESYFVGWARVSVLTFVLAAVGCVWLLKQVPELFFGSLVLSLTILMMGAGVGIALLYFKDGWLAAWIHVAAGILVLFILYFFLLPVAGGEKEMETIINPFVHLLANEFL